MRGLRVEVMGALLGSLCLGLSLGAATGVQEVYSTGFEPPEYEVGFTLAEQGGWVSDAVGGNQVYKDYFEGMGQHGLIGFSKPQGTVDTVSVWRPLNVDPVAAGNPVVTFTVVISIADSIVHPSRRDSFRWSVYNTNAVPRRLFSLDFDNATTNIAYLLDDDEGFVLTPYYFERDGLYDLAITMDFAANHWSASLNDQTVVERRPMTTVGAALHLGDIDAVWVRADGNAEFGDNYMVFDDYRVVMAPATAPRLELVEVGDDGAVVVAVEGDEGQEVGIEFSDDLVEWGLLTTGTVPASGRFTYVDEAAAGAPRGFYRGRSIP
ncbi:MAG: hypothetical protein KJ072_12240 [Verrucomicrobia bacterium]|nr:hypothetical protein [Verrucomicrobiota bacterium]